MCFVEIAMILILFCVVHVCCGYRYSSVVVRASPSAALLAAIFNECGSSHRLRKNVNATLETNSLKITDDDYMLSALAVDSPAFRLE